MAKPKRKEEQPEKSQRERFIETAREVEVDESGEAFERAIKKIAVKSVKPSPRNGS